MKERVGLGLDTLKHDIITLRPPAFTLTLAPTQVSSTVGGGGGGGAGDAGAAAGAGAAVPHQRRAQHLDRQTVRQVARSGHQVLQQRAWLPTLRALES